MIIFFAYIGIMFNIISLIVLLYFFSNSYFASKKEWKRVKTEYELWNTNKKSMHNLIKEIERYSSSDETYRVCKLLKESLASNSISSDMSKSVKEIFDV